MNDNRVIYPAKHGILVDSGRVRHTLNTTKAPRLRQQSGAANNLMKAG